MTREPSPLEGCSRDDRDHECLAVDGAVAFSYGLTHLHGTKTDGGDVDLWFRSTIGLSAVSGSWQIVHEHDSTPFYMDGSGRAALDLRP
jgi:ketosteroid isomerase-like protein